MKTSFLGLLLFSLLSTRLASQSAITGRLLGCDGRPMAMSHVHVDGGLGHFDPASWLHDVNYARVQTDPDGSFNVSTDVLGALYLVFTGVGHRMMQVPLILEKPTTLRIEAQLRSQEYASSFDDVEVRYDSDRAKGARIKMKRQADGTFVAEIPTDMPTLSYTLLRIGGAPWEFSPATNGTMADSFRYLDDGLYECVVHPKNGMARIMFDPSRLLRCPTSERITFRDSTCLQARFADLVKSFGKIKQEYNLALRVHMKAGKRFKDFSYDWSTIAKRMRKKIQSETVPLLRKELIIEYLELATLPGKGIDREFLRKQLQNVSASSQAWVYHLDATDGIESFHPDGQKYVDRILTRHLNRNFRARLLYRLCASAKMERRQSEYDRLFYKLTNDFADTPAGRSAKVHLQPRDKIKPGAEIPEFSFASLDEPSVKFTKKNFAHKYLLLDFWATWCSPCVGQMKYLDKAYQRFHGDNFEILSIAAQDSRSRVQKFRSTNWKMPWLNAFVEENEYPDVSLTFEVTFPKLILIDPTGRILEVDNNLEGEELEKTLDRYLGSSR